MDKMLAIQPLFIALTGARDRAKHEGTPVGCTAGRFTLDFKLGVVTDKVPSAEVQARIESTQRAALRIIQHTLQTMANDISFLVSQEHTPASVTFAPECLTAVMPEQDAYMRECQRVFFDHCSGDDKAMSALSGVTRKLVMDWGS